MALQAGVSTSKVLILVGAGFTSSIILKNGRLSELIGQLQEILKGVDQVELAPYKYDSALLAAQIRQLAQEIKELTLSSPATIYNRNYASNGSFSSYLAPAAALGAMGYCYMWWKDWSFSDVMFVTKKNMANAVATVSKQLENVSETLASTKRHLTKRLENLDWKVEEQIETSKLIASDVDEMKSNLSQIGYDVEAIHQMISGLEGKLEILESKQDTTNSGLWHLCQFAGGFKDGPGTKVYQDVGAKLANHSAMVYEERSRKGLQFIAETKESDMVEKPVENVKKDLDTCTGEKVKTVKTRIHRSYPLLRSSSPWHHRGETETMPKNKGKGGKNRKRGKNEADDEKRELIFKEDGQEYAQVLRMLGNGRCEAMCIDGTKRLCHIRGKMHKKVWIAAGDIILVGLRDYQDDKADVILKYMPDEARLLKAYGELPENTRLNEGIAGGLDEEDDGAGDDYIEFEDEDIDKI
ncbi:hypothetical protein OIU74_011571 [Salix koriyanagi]|uniref:Eukaryotic translation initiation factor 4C n=1 Tax=Salix koriyanagi TaxID=2511006 RepID=A0A9Q0TFL6_9ROSI|nr:hypothetical protein OIU74_011571 [Salix koriyanagi]